MAKLGQPSAANSFKVALKPLWMIWIVGHAEEKDVRLRIRERPQKICNTPGEMIEASPSPTERKVCGNVHAARKCHEEVP
jgi:hypothetical protein